MAKFVQVDKDGNVSEPLDTRKGLVIGDQSYGKKWLYRKASENKRNALGVYTVNEIELTKEQRKYQDTVVEIQYDSGTDTVSEVLVSAVDKPDRQAREDADVNDAIDSQIEAQTSALHDAIEDMYNAMLAKNFRPSDFAQATRDLFTERSNLKGQRR